MLTLIANLLLSISEQPYVSVPVQAGMPHPWFRVCTGTPSFHSEHCHIKMQQKPKICVFMRCGHPQIAPGTPRLPQAPPHLRWLQQPVVQALVGRNSMPPKAEVIFSTLHKIMFVTFSEHSFASVSKSIVY